MQSRCIEHASLPNHPPRQVHLDPAPPDRRVLHHVPPLGRRRRPAVLIYQDPIGATTSLRTVPLARVIATSAQRRVERRRQQTRARRRVAPVALIVVFQAAVCIPSRRASVQAVRNSGVARAPGGAQGHRVAQRARRRAVREASIQRPRSIARPRHKYRSGECSVVGDAQRIRPAALLAAVA